MERGSILCMFPWIYTLIVSTQAGQTCIIQNGARTKYCEYGCCGDSPSETCCPIAIWIIVLGIIGGLFGVCLVVGIACCCFMKNRYKRKRMTRTAPSHHLTSSVLSPCKAAYRKGSFKGQRPTKPYFSPKVYRNFQSHRNNLQLPPLRVPGYPKQMPGYPQQVPGHPQQQQQQHDHIEELCDENLTQHQHRCQTFEQDQHAHNPQRRSSMQRDQQKRRASFQFHLDQDHSPARQHQLGRRPSDQSEASSCKDHQQRSPSIQIHVDQSKTSDITQNRLESVQFHTILDRQNRRSSIQSDQHSDQHSDHGHCSVRQNQDQRRRPSKVLEARRLSHDIVHFGITKHKM